jgi:hypothetical protein
MAPDFYNLNSNLGSEFNKETEFREKDPEVDV